MTLIQKKIITDMRSNGASYAEIANTLELSKNTVKSYCQRNKLFQTTIVKKDNCTYCKQCGQEMEIIAGRKLKKFCSDKCRMAWWVANPNQLNRKATYNFTCAFCGADFTAYGNQSRKFCGHACYISSRFGKAGRLPCGEMLANTAGGAAL